MRASCIAVLLGAWAFLPTPAKADTFTVDGAVIDYNNHSGIFERPNYLAFTGYVVDSAVVTAIFHGEDEINGQRTYFGDSTDDHGLTFISHYHGVYNTASINVYQTGLAPQTGTGTGPGTIVDIWNGARYDRLDYGVEGTFTVTDVLSGDALTDLSDGSWGFLWFNWTYDSGVIQYVSSSITVNYTIPPPPPPPADVPEPASVTLAFLGLASLGAARTARRQAG